MDEPTWDVEGVSRLQHGIDDWITQLLLSEVAAGEDLK